MADTLPLNPATSAALQSVVAKLADWEKLPDRLQILGAQAAAIQTAAQAKGDQGTVAAMSAVLGQLSQLHETQTASAPALGDVLAAVNALQAHTADLSLGTIAEAAELALTITVGLANADRQEAQILASAPRVLTAQQVAALGIGNSKNGGAPTSSHVGEWALYALGGGFLYYLWRKKRRRR